MRIKYCVFQNRTMDLYNSIAKKYAVKIINYGGPTGNFPPAADRHCSWRSFQRTSSMTKLSVIRETQEYPHTEKMATYPVNNIEPVFTFDITKYPAAKRSD